MQEHRLRKAGYCLVAFLAIGCCCSSVLSFGSSWLAGERPAKFGPWVLAFGGMLIVVASAWATVRVGRAYWRNWQLRLFGTKKCAVLADKDAKEDYDGDFFWYARVTGDGFDKEVFVGLRDPGEVGSRLRVRHHVPSGQVGLVRRTPGAITIAVIADVLQLAALLTMASIAGGIAFGLARGAIGLLR